MASLLILRSINLQTTKHTWIAMNVDHCGAFDDIILYRQTIDDSEIIYLIQLKHENKGTPVKPGELLTWKNSPFLLSKYFDSITEIKNESKKGAKPKNDIKDAIDVLWFNRNRIVFALFTNRGSANTCDFLNEVVRKSDLDTKWLLFETVDTNGKIYEFDYTKINKKFADEDRDFMERFFLFTKQLHVNQLDDAISNAIKSFIQPAQIPKELLGEISVKFISFVTEWSKGSLGGYYPLTKVHILKILAELLLKSYTVQLSKPGDILGDVVEHTIWDDLIAKKEVTIVNGADEVVQHFLEEFLHSRIAKWLNHTADEKSLDENLLRIVTSKKLAYEEVYETLWRVGEVPLLIQIDTAQGIRQIQNVLRLAKGIFRLIILNKTDTVLEKLKFFQPFVNIGDLEVHQREDLLRTPVKLQGRKSIVLEKFFNKKMFKCVTVKDIIYILSDRFSVGNAFEALPEFFIERSLRKASLETEVLQKVQDDIFVIECKSCSKFRLFIEQNSLDIKEDQVIHWKNVDKITPQVKIVVFENAQDLNKIQKFVFKKPVHFLVWHGSYSCELELVKSSDIKRILPFRKTTSAKIAMAEGVVRDLCGKKTVTLLSAGPGMGKSVLMKYFAQNAPTNVWVLKIDLPAYKKLYEKWNKSQPKEKKDENCKAFIEQIWIDQACSGELTRAVFESYLHSNNVLLLLDGFDEIAIDYQKGAKNLIQFLNESGYIVCLTTRPVLRNDLESTLNVFAMGLNPFSRLNQQYFLDNYFAKVAKVSTSDVKLQNFVKELLSASRKNLNDQDLEFTGVPLQTTLLAEVFVDDCVKYLSSEKFQNEHFDLVYLYKKFTEKKIEIACDKIESTSEDMIKQYRIFRTLFALRVLFNETDLLGLKIEEKLQMRALIPNLDQLIQKDGIVVAENHADVKFVHQTFAEYLAAEWLVDNINGEGEETARILIRRIFHPSLIVVRNIFDRILSAERPLHLAIINHRVDEVRQIMSSETKLDETDDGGRSFFHLISSWGLHHPRVYKKGFITLRMAKGDDMIAILKLIPDNRLVLTKDDLGYTPLDYACLSRSLNIANAIYARLRNITQPLPLPAKAKGLLLEYCSDLNYSSLIWGLHKADLSLPIQVGQNVSDMFQAVSTEDVDRVRLIATSVNTNEKNQDGFSPLHIAAERGHIELVQILLSNNADVNSKDQSGKTALHWAARGGHPNVVLLLISNGIDVSVVDEANRTALHYAVGLCSNTNDSNQYETVLALLNTQFHPNIIDIKDQTQMSALHWASEIGETSMVDLLLSKGADVNLPSISASTSLHLAAGNGYAETVDLLLTKDLTIMDLRNDLGMTALHRAAYNDHPDVVKLLLAKGADSQLKDNLGFIPLHLAATYGQATTVKLLLSQSNIETPDNDGGTALVLAAQNNHEDTVSLLLSKEADIEATDHQGGTPLNWAAHNRHTNVLNTLLSHGAYIDVQENRGITPLHWAINNGDLDTVNLLISKGANVDKRNNEATAPLHWAIYYGHMDILYILLSAGAAIEDTDSKGMTALIMAARTGHLDVVKLLLSKGADLTAKDNEGTSSLHWAANNGHTDIVNLLLLRGAPLDARDDQDMSALHLATCSGYINVVNSILSEGINIDTKANENKTPLILAAQFGQMDTIRFLLAKGANIEAKDTQGRTALHQAASNGHKDSVELLVSRGANLDARDLQDMSALHWAVSNNHTEVVGFLLSKNADIDAKNIKAATPLHWAAYNGHVDIIELLQSKGADTGAKDEQGKSALHWGVCNGHSNAVQLLLTKGCPTESKDDQGMTPLHWAARNNQTDSITLLLSNEANIDAQDVKNKSPLHWATSNAHIETMVLLLTKGSNIEAKDNQGMTALHWASLDGRVDVIKLLLSKGATINAQDDEGKTAVHWASCAGHTIIVDLFLSTGCDVDLKDLNDATPLHWAVQNNHKDTTEFLLAKGASVNAVSHTQFSALHWAAFNGDVDVANLLLMKGAHIEAKDASAMTALHYTAHEGHKDVVNLLMSKGANVNEIGRKDMSALHWAACNGHVDVVNILLSKGSELEAKSDEDMTPLHFAVQDGRKEVVEFLLSKGADINAKDDQERSPLHWAASNGHKELVELLLDKNADIGRDKNGLTLINLAEKHDHMEIKVLLLEAETNMSHRSVNLEVQ